MDPQNHWVGIRKVVETTSQFSGSCRDRLREGSLFGSEFEGPRHVLLCCMTVPSEEMCRASTFWTCCNGTMLK